MIRYFLLTVILFLAYTSRGQFKAGDYRHERSTEGWHVDLKLFKDHTFTFNDMRDKGCHWMWSEFAGKWSVAGDTLVLYILPRKESGTNTQPIPGNDLPGTIDESDIRKFLIVHNSIIYAFADERNFFRNWGRFEWVGEVYR